MDIDLYKFLIKNEDIQLELRREFIYFIKNEILYKYGTLKKYYQLERKDISYGTLKSLFYLCRFYSIGKIVKIINNLNINQKLLLDNIISFRFHGSHVETKLPRFLHIDNQFIQGYSLYIAEGNTGLNGKTKPQKLRLTSSDLSIINFFKNWIIKYFNQSINTISYYVYLPLDESLDYKKYQRLLKSNNLHIYHDKSVTIPKYRICMDRKAIIDLFFDIEGIVKNMVINNNKLAQYYLKGLYDGEGTAYCKKFKYVRIEMKNKKEMNFLSVLLNNLKINHKLEERNTRKGMYSAYISKKDNINKFSNLIGFELTPKKQEVLNKIVNYYEVDFPYYTHIS